MHQMGREQSLTTQVRQDIMEHIRNKDYPEGVKIPTEKEFCERYGVSRITIRNAILSLVNDGVLFRVKGKGTFVKRKQINWMFMTKDTSFNQQILSMGMTPSTNVLNFEVIKASEAIAENLCIQEGESVIHLLRLRYANREPMAIVESFHPYELCKHIMECDFSHLSLHEALNSNAETNIVKVVRYVEAVPANSTETLLLSVPKGSPIQLFTNYAMNSRYQIVDYCVSYFRGDKSRFTVEIFPSSEP